MFMGFLCRASGIRIEYLRRSDRHSPPNPREGTARMLDAIFLAGPVILFVALVAYTAFCANL
jgi:hypothetical protein